MIRMFDVMVSCKFQLYFNPYNEWLTTVGSKVWGLSCVKNGTSNA